MLNSEKEKENLTLVLSEIFFRKEIKSHPPSPPPLQVKWSVP